MSETTEGNSGEPENLRKVFFGDLSSKTDDANLRAYCKEFGNVVKCSVDMDPKTGRSYGSGYVTYADVESVDSLMQKRSHSIDGKEIYPKRAISATPSISGGNGGGRRVVDRKGDYGGCYGSSSGGGYGGGGRSGRKGGYGGGYGGSSGGGYDGGYGSGGGGKRDGYGDSCGYAYYNGKLQIESCFDRILLPKFLWICTNKSSRHDFTDHLALIRVLFLNLFIRQTVNTKNCSI
jgi:RNA recognition motif-containing protein